LSGNAVGGDELGHATRRNSGRREAIADRAYTAGASRCAEPQAELIVEIEHRDLESRRIEQARLRRRVGSIEPW